VFELLLITEPVQRRIQTHATAAEIRSLAIQEGMRPMRLDGHRMIRESMTTIEEVARVTGEI